jgi:chromate reductase
MKKIAILLGSLRKESFTRKITEALIQSAPPFLKFEYLDIGGLPLYNQDLDETHPPVAWQAFRQKLKTYDGILFATPEYNRSIPGVLKNAIDVGSRPYGQSAFEKKPGAVISVSPGAGGAFGANHHLRQCLVFLDVPAMAQPEIYISHVTKLLDDSGRVNNDKTTDLLAKFGSEFAKWVDLHSNSL